MEESSLEVVQGLATALLTMWLDIEAGLHRSGDTLVKGLQDGAGLAGVLLLHLLQSPGLPRRRRITLVRRLNTPQLLPTVEKLFPAAAGREALRLALAQLAAEASIMSSVDSDLVISLCGRLLSKQLFPQGPDQGQHEGLVRHQSYGPWLAERDRCNKVEEVMGARREERGGREAGRLTGEVVRLHDQQPGSGSGGRGSGCAASTRPISWQALYLLAAGVHTKVSTPGTAPARQLKGHSGQLELKKKKEKIYLIVCVMWSLWTPRSVRERDPSLSPCL